MGCELDAAAAYWPDPRLVDGPLEAEFAVAGVPAKVPLGNFEAAAALSRPMVDPACALCEVEIAEEGC